MFLSVFKKILLLKVFLTKDSKLHFPLVLTSLRPYPLRNHIQQYGKRRGCLNLCSVQQATLNPRDRFKKVNKSLHEGDI